MEIKKFSKKTFQLINHKRKFHLTIPKIFKFENFNLEFEDQKNRDSDSEK
jgi:hypothetical protein